MRTSKPLSDSVRHYAQQAYVQPARRKGEKTISINVGQVHKAVAFQNRVPVVCQALESKKFLEANRLRLISKTGPPSGQSTTVTYTYELIDTKAAVPAQQDPWPQLRGVLKDVFADLGGGDAYLRSERDTFHRTESPASREGE
jgi:hypothetical protein